MLLILQSSTLKSTVIQCNNWHRDAGTHIHIFESSQLEGSYVRDLLYMSLYIYIFAHVTYIIHIYICIIIIHMNK